MVAYVDIFWLLFLICVALLPLTLLMRNPPSAGGTKLEPILID